MKSDRDKNRAPLLLYFLRWIDIQLVVNILMLVILNLVVHQLVNRGLLEPNVGNAWIEQLCKLRTAASYFYLHS